MVADGLEVAVVRGLLLRAVDWALGAIDVEDHSSGGPAHHVVEPRQTLPVLANVLLDVASPIGWCPPRQRGAPRAAFLAGVTRLWAGAFSLQIENVG